MLSFFSSYTSLEYNEHEANHRPMFFPVDKRKKGLRKYANIPRGKEEQSVRAKNSSVLFPVFPLETPRRSIVANRVRNIFSHRTTDRKRGTPCQCAGSYI